MTTLDTRPDLLTDDMLARFDERRRLRPRQPLLPGGLRRAAGGRLPEGRPPHRVRRRGPEPGRGEPAAAPARLPRAGHRRRRQHAHLLGRRRRHLHAAGDPSCDWMLERAAEGHVFAAGHGEAGNDLPLLLSTSKAERVEGGWEITGHKIFGSLSPVWTYLGLHAMDTSNPDAPQIVHAFLDRDAPRYRIEETWDTLGMRATSQRHHPRPPFIPDARSRWCAPPASPVPACSRSASSPGACSASPPCTAPSPTVSTTTS